MIVTLTMEFSSLGIEALRSPEDLAQLNHEALKRHFQQELGYLTKFLRTIELSFDQQSEMDEVSAVGGRISAYYCCTKKCVPRFA